MCRGGNPVTCPGGKWISCGYREVDLGVADDEDQVKSVSWLLSRARHTDRPRCQAREPRTAGIRAHWASLCGGDAACGDGDGKSGLRGHAVV